MSPGITICFFFENWGEEMKKNDQNRKALVLEVGGKEFPHQ